MIITGIVVDIVVVVVAGTAAVVVDHTVGIVASVLVAGTQVAADTALVALALVVAHTLVGRTKKEYQLYVFMYPFYIHTCIM